ncbi:zinc finger MYM-type protein 1-like [Sipha flava]|uniref:Zinc finger MYM-type protein 1-like n=1 Tax=Sipha flava TaxID=143950 RepID=A0A8B8F8Q4_9HEMI|nr:zinc finger MYM-type protein 1-like [Sipha flava]
MNSLSNSLNATQTVISSSSSSLPSTVSASDTPITQFTPSTTDINQEMLSKIWVPDINYNFPIKISVVGKQQKVLKLKFQYKWLISFPWLAYSEVNSSVFCKYCVAFTKTEAGVNNQKLGAFVLIKYDDWKHALENFKNHSNLEYHKKSLLDADNFLNMLKNPTRAVILCSRQNLALRGHRGSGKIESNESKVMNEGNFREILRYRAQGDIEMKTYLESLGKMKYTSHRSQNNMIDACNKILLDKVVSRVNTAKCFSILADETVDISGVEQVSLCVRYFNSNTLKLTEEFLQFVPTNNMTGKGIANLILENLEQFGINTQYLHGQGYDGAAAMAGKFNGVQAHIKEIHPNALYVHCSAHSLNLAVSKSCSVPAIRDCLGTISQIRDFFIYPKRKSVLIHKIEKSSETPSKKTLKRSCETRWIERYHAVHDFFELFEYVEEALEDISEWNDNDTSEKSYQKFSSKQA